LKKRGGKYENQQKAKQGRWSEKSSKRNLARERKENEKPKEGKSWY